MSWSEKYKRSIDCDNPKGFSQRAHCQGRKKKLKEQFKPFKTVEQIAKKHRLDVSFIQKQLDMGEPIEHEHTKDHKLAKEIALQHLDEIPDYYTRLKKMEASAKKEHKKFKDVTEEKGGSLHYWYQGSSGKTKTGKRVRGWVKPDGSPCANEPGETKTPKCFSSARLASLKRKGKKGESIIKAAVRRKREKDPGQQSKSGGAKPTLVKTFAKGKKDPNYIKPEPGLKEAMEINEAQRDIKGKGSGKKDACYHKVKSRYDVWPSAYASGALVKCRKVGAKNWGTKSEQIEMQRYCPKCKKNETQSECKYGPRFWAMYSTPITLTSNQLKYDIAQVHPANEEKDHEYSMARSQLSTVMSAVKRLKKKMKGEGNIEAWVQSKITKASDYLDAAADYLDSGEHDVEESLTIEDSNGNSFAEVIDVIGPNQMEPIVDEGCWKGYKQFGMKKKGDKLVPNCVKESYSDWRQESLQEGLPLAGLARLVLPGLARGLGQGAMKSLPYILAPEAMKTITVAQAATPAISAVAGASRKIAADQEAKNLERKKQLAAQGVYVEKYKKGYSDWRQELTEDWQKVNKQDKTDGMSPAAVKAYRRENPGSKLKTAVTGDPKPGSKDSKRRKSFCSRSKGQQDMHNIDCSKDPDKAICKARRRWKC